MGKIGKRSLSQNTPRNGIWASAGKQGEHYGVFLGEGDKIVGFLPESWFTPENLEKVRADKPTDAELIRRAWEDLPRLKAEVDYLVEQHQNG